MICATNNSNGKPCKAPAMLNSVFCWFHNPEVSEEDKIDACARGGRAKQGFTECYLPELKISTPKDVAKLLANTINNMRSGKTSVRFAYAYGIISNVMLKAFRLAQGYEPEEPSGGKGQIKSVNSLTLEDIMDLDTSSLDAGTSDNRDRRLGVRARKVPSSPLERGRAPMVRGVRLYELPPPAKGGQAVGAMAPHPSPWRGRVGRGVEASSP